MKRLIAGHLYELESFDGGRGQQIQFIQKQGIPGSFGQLETVTDGTTNEEVLAVLIDRLIYLNLKVPSRETALAITRCQEALLWLQERTRDRTERGVEGTREA